MIAAGALLDQAADSGVARFLRALHPHDTPGVSEVRVITIGATGGPSVSFYQTPPDGAEIARLAKRHPAGNIYVGVAKRRDRTSGKKANLSGIYALWTDLDFKTAPEAECRKRLAECPLPPSIIVATGGGFHVYWMLIEPLDAVTECALAESYLRRLAGYFDGDPACAEVARVLRIPGTLNHKDDPPRPVVQERLDINCCYNASDFDEWLPADSGKPAPLKTPKPVNGHRTKVGERHAALLARAGQLRRIGVEPDAIEALLVVENQTRFEQPKDDPREIHDIAAFVGTKDPAAEAGHRRVTLTSADQIAIRPVRWLWQDRIAVGTLSLLGGREGIGKSILGYTLAAEITRGTLPGIVEGVPRHVLVVATEDSWEHTIKPRLMAAGADLRRIHRVNVVTAEGIETGLTLPLDLAALESAIHEVNAVLILLDPLLSRLDAALDTHKDAEVRLALEPLVRLATAADIAIMGLIHVNKSTRPVTHSRCSWGAGPSPPLPGACCSLWLILTTTNNVCSASRRTTSAGRIWPP